MRPITLDYERDGDSPPLFDAGPSRDSDTREADTPVANNLDLLIKDGHVIDPKNGVNGIMDVGISGDSIASVAPNVSSERAENVVDASGLYVTPGLIDIHVHAFHGTRENAAHSGGYSSIKPDGHTFRSGTTTIVDPGGAGWRNINEFITDVVDHHNTRVLALINVVGSGMKGGVVEQNLRDMDPKLTAMAAEEHSDVVVGIKLAHYRGHDWEPIQRTVEAGEQADLPVMIDLGDAAPPLSLETLFFDYLRPGDIFTHCYANLDQQGRRQSIVDTGGVLRPHVIQAQERGIVFDVGHGLGSFDYIAAVPATEAGLWPDTVSTDLYDLSVNAGMKDLTNVMSKMLELGMKLEQVIQATTSEPARVIRRPDLGHLGEGAPADVAVFDLQSGDFGFVDSSGRRRSGSQKLVTELTVRAGDVVWDLNGIAASEWER